MAATSFACGPLCLPSTLGRRRWGFVGAGTGPGSWRARDCESGLARIPCRPGQDAGAAAALLDAFMTISCRWGFAVGLAGADGECGEPEQAGGRLAGRQRARPAAEPGARRRCQPAGAAGRAGRPRRLRRPAADRGAAGRRISVAGRRAADGSQAGRTGRITKVKRALEARWSSPGTCSDLRDLTARRPAAWLPGLPAAAAARARLTGIVCRHARRSRRDPGRLFDRSRPQAQTLHDPAHIGVELQPAKDT
jgi:hypothetical protein